MLREEKCKTVNSIIGNYFRINSSKSSVLARDLYYGSHKMQELFASDKTMRAFFRAIDSDGVLSTIPYLIKEDASCKDGRWYFKRIK